jgi:Cft2 family RNA processing exonuclease
MSILCDAVVHVCCAVLLWMCLHQVCGYDGPVFMTHPTRAIAPIMLHDFYK